MQMNTASRFRSRMGFPGGRLGVMAGSVPLGGYAPASGGFTGDGIGEFGVGGGGGLAALAGIGGATPSASRAASAGGAAVPALSGQQTFDAMGFPTDGNPSDPFDNPNVTYDGWMSTVAPIAASLIGGPIGGTVFGGLMGAHMAQEARDTYSRAGLLTDNLPSVLGGVIAGATRGLSGLLGLTPSLQSIQNTYASLPTLDDRMAQLNHHLDFAQSVLGGGDDAASATGDSYGQGPDASDASGGGYMF